MSFVTFFQPVPTPEKAITQRFNKLVDAIPVTVDNLEVKIKYFKETCQEALSLLESLSQRDSDRLPAFKAFYSNIHQETEGLLRNLENTRSGHDIDPALSQIATKLRTLIIETQANFQSQLVGLENDAVLADNTQNRGFTW